MRFAFSADTRRIAQSLIKVRIVAAFVCFALFNARSGRAVEPWAHPNLAIREGLVLWLDAARATGNQPAPADGKLNEWRDVAGKNRRLKSPSKSARPLVLKVGTEA